jgi:hypothetical protein
LVETCWQQDPKKRSSFQELVERFGSADFVNDKIDEDHFHAYKSCVLP